MIIHIILSYMVGILLGCLAMSLSRRKYGREERRFKRDFKKVQDVLKKNQGVWLAIEDIRKKMLFKIDSHRIESVLDVLCHTNPSYRRNSLSQFIYYQNIK